MEDKTAIQKLQSITIAVNLLWASLMIGIVKMLFSISIISALNPAKAISISVLTLCIISLLIFNISSGKNWARITFLAFFILGLPSLRLVFVLNEFSRFPVLVGILSATQVGLQGYALFLLFTRPGSNWFRKPVPNEVATKR